MKVFQVIYETETNGEMIDQIHYVSGPDIGCVAADSQAHANNYGKELKSIRYLFNIVKHVEGK